MEGTARLFSKDKTLSVRTRVEDGTLDKLVRFIGPVGLSDKSGVFSVAGRHEVTLFQDKRIQVVSGVRFDVHDVDMTGDAQETIRLASGTARLDTRLSIEPDGRNNLQGAIETSGEGFSLEDSRGLSLTVGSAKVATSDMDIDIQTGKNRRLNQVYQSVQGESETAMPLAELFLALMEALAKELGNDEFSARGAVSVQAGEVNLSTSDERNAKGVQAQVGSWAAHITNVAVDSVPPRLNAGGEVETTLSGISATIRLPESQTSFSSEEVTLVLEKYQETTENDSILVDVTGSTGLKTAKVSVSPSGSGPGQDLSVGLLSVRYSDVNLKKVTDTTTFQGRIDLSAAGLDTRLADKMAFGAGKFGLILAQLQGDATKQSASIDLVGNNSESRKEGSAPPATSQIRADRVAIGAGSRINFTDGSVTPPVKAAIQIKEFVLGDFDTAEPEKHSTLKIDAVIDDVAELKTEGWGSPLHSEPDFDLALSVQRLQLPTYSPYSAKLAGLSIDSGDLSAKLKATSARKKLDGLLEVKVRDLDLGPASREAAENFEKTFDSPADFAVAVLEDRQGIIALEFPLSGTLDRPVVDFSQVVNRAMRGEMAGFSTKGKGALLQPIFFQPGSVRLDDGQRAELDRIARLMTRKPKLSIRMCGRATAEDFSALQKGSAGADSGQNETAVEGRRDQGDSGSPPKTAEKPGVGRTLTKEEANQLIDLALKRTRVVRDYLAADMKIDTERLGECRATYSLHDKQPPRVHLSP